MLLHAANADSAAIANTPLRIVPDLQSVKNAFTGKLAIAIAAMSHWGGCAEQYCACDPTATCTLTLSGCTAFHRLMYQ